MLNVLINTALQSQKVVIALGLCFINLKLEIALAISASNEWKIIFVEQYRQPFQCYPYTSWSSG